MTVSIAHLGPTGTYTEAAALHCAHWFKERTGQTAELHPYPSIYRTIQAVSQGEVKLAVVPVENSIGGTVTVTLDTLWQLETLQIHLALVLPIDHALISQAASLSTIETVYSHPQALAQCQNWLETSLPKAKLIPINSTTESLQHLDSAGTVAAIASQRAAELYGLPILAYPISDHPENCTRFWVLSQEASLGGSHTSLAFSLPANRPGSLVKPLQIFADRQINLSRIESRPTKRSLGDYLFFMDLEADAREEPTRDALTELAQCTETLKIFGSYEILLV